MKKIILLVLFSLLYVSCKEKTENLITVRGTLLMETENVIMFKKDNTKLDKSIRKQKRQITKEFGSCDNYIFSDNEFKVCGKILMENDSMIFIHKEPLPIDDTIGWLGDSLYISEELIENY